MCSLYGTNTAGATGCDIPSFRASPTIPTIWSHESAIFGADSEPGESSSSCGSFTDRPMAPPVREIALRHRPVDHRDPRPVRFSASSQIRPATSGMRRMPKYSGLTRFTDAFCCSAAGCPRISNRESQPFRGGVALLEIAAIVTPGVSATFARSCSK